MLRCGCLVVSVLVLLPTVASPQEYVDVSDELKLIFIVGFTDIS